MIKLTYFFVPALVIIAIVGAIIKKKNAYSAFINGSKEGLNLFKEVFPSVLAMLLAVTLLDNCGILDDLSLLLGNVFSNMNLISDITPMLIFRPISGSASIAVLENVCKGDPDGLSCKIVSTIQGSTDTTLYVLALYFSSIGITKWRHALKSGLIADVVGMFIAIVLALIFLR